MILSEIIQVLEREIPLNKAENWDNPGLQTGDRKKEIRKVYIALDPSLESIREASDCGADLLLTHHPMTIGAITKVNTDTLTGKRFFEAIRNDLCVYSMHTNYDVVRMGKLAGERIGLIDPEVLSVTGTDSETGKPEGFGEIGKIKEMTLADFCLVVYEAFSRTSVRCFGDSRKTVRCAAILPGSGKSMTQDALEKGADVYVTGDMGHHEALDAMEQGMTVIDAGHYGIEHIFLEDMADFFAENFPEIEVKTAQIRHPFF